MMQHPLFRPAVKGKGQWLCLLLCCCLSLGMEAQSNANSFQVRSTPINFNLTSPVALETPQIQANAFELVVQSRHAYSIYVSAQNAPNNFPLNLLGLRLRSVTPSDIPVNYNTYLLSFNNQLIAQGAKTNIGSDKTYIWSYDMLLAPVGYEVAPGTYSFTVLFTMTQP